jgi:hypothetical protein
MLGYGVTLYRAFSVNEWEDMRKQVRDGWPEEIEFFSSLDLEMSDRFVIFNSGETLGSVNASAMRVGRTELTDLMVTGCSRWQDEWPHWPKS